MRQDLADLRTLFDAGVAAVSGDNAVRHALEKTTAKRICLVAVGKAATSMTQGALDVLAERVVNALVISKYDHINDVFSTDSRIQCLESAHPVPDDHSLIAGEALQSFVSSVPDDALLLVLISGGASALVEVLPDGMTLSDLQKVNQYLLGAGLDIHQMNVIRKSLSMIKGGRLAAQIGCPQTLQLLISDVPGDTVGGIGSGLLVPPDDAPPELPADVEPAWLSALQNRNISPPAPDAGIWKSIDSRIIASNTLARNAVASSALSLDYAVQLQHGELDGDVTRMAQSMTDVLCATDAERGVYIWGGETTVQLPDTPGRGGRNQHLSLQLALNLSMALAAQPRGNSAKQWCVLVCGTDGSDGPTADAGGVLDASTLVRGQALGLQADEYLTAADAGAYLEKTGALVTTGPTGTNVMDLAIVILA